MTPEQVKAELAGSLPPATLVVGPGAWETASEAMGPDWEAWWDLDADGARRVRTKAYLMPLGERRVLLLKLDGTTWQVQNILLKVLEDPPRTTRFVLAAADQPLPTVVSRCRVLALGRPLEQEARIDAQDKAAVATAIKAARSGQGALLSQAVRDWHPEHVRLLGAWAAEAASGNWRLFGPDFAPGVGPQQAMALIVELGRYQGSRIGPMVALDKVFSEE